MPELERMLASVGEEIAWPPTPDLSRSVMARLETDAAANAERPTSAERAALGERPAPVVRRRLPVGGSLRRSLVLAALALLILAGGVYAAVPGVRDAVKDFLGLQGATVERRATLPTPRPERALDLGTRTTLEAAGERIAFAPLVPAALGPPDRVYLRRGLPGGELSLAYRPRPGLPRAGTTDLGALLSEFRGDLVPEYIEKVAGPATSTERLTIDGDRAIWIEGAPHFLIYRDPSGDVIESTMRLAQNVLLLERGDLLIRLEGAFGRDRAVAIARSLG
jgi:hypothetical protein